VDKKLQGRILAAISELSETPNVSHGDTVKPLVGDLKGLWRYRLGDYRLVFQVQLEKRLVVLLEFAARGEVYDA
jgi:mRNA interferase RelE/StbE